MQLFLISTIEQRTLILYIDVKCYKHYTYINLYLYKKNHFKKIVFITLAVVSFLYT